MEIVPLHTSKLLTAYHFDHPTEHCYFESVDRDGVISTSLGDKSSPIIENTLPGFIVYPAPMDSEIPISNNDMEVWGGGILREYPNEKEVVVRAHVWITKVVSSPKYIDDIREGLIEPLDVMRYIRMYRGLHISRPLHDFLGVPPIVLRLMNTQSKDFERVIRSL